MRWEIDLMAPSVTRGAAGGTVEGFAKAATVWSEKQDVNAGEAMAGGAVAATTHSTFRIYHRDDIASDWRIRHPAGEAGRLYQITGITELGFREGLLISAHVEHGGG